jgi:hypothetical protein
MTPHFLSFILDIATWLIFGAMYGRYIQRLDRSDNKSGNIVTLKISLLSLLGGLIATADHSLPEYGFSLYHFGVAAIFAIIYSLKHLKIISRYRVKYTRELLKLSNINSLRKAIPFGKRTRVIHADASL